MEMEEKKELYRYIDQIINRAEKLNLIPENFERINLLMTLEAANEAFGMDFDAMLKADTYNFAHDFIGINNNVVPHQGEKIGKPYTSEDFNYFVPRFAQAEKSKYKKPQHDSIESNRNVGDGVVGRNVEKKI